MLYFNITYTQGRIQGGQTGALTPKIMVGGAPIYQTISEYISFNLLYNAYYNTNYNLFLSSIYNFFLEKVNTYNSSMKEGAKL